MTRSHPIAAALVLVPKQNRSIPDDRTLQLVRKTKKVGTLTNLRACMDVTWVRVSAFDYECLQVRERANCSCVRKTLNWGCCGVHQISSEKNNTRQPADEGWGTVDARMSIRLSEAGWVGYQCIALSAWALSERQELSACAKENCRWALD